jgi:hypothetical protein
MPLAQRAFQQVMIVGHEIGSSTGLWEPPGRHRGRPGHRSFDDGGEDPAVIRATRPGELPHNPQLWPVGDKGSCCAGRFLLLAVLHET